MVFPVVMYGCESWTIKKAKRQRIDAFELWCWRRLLRVPWITRRSNQLVLKEISPEYHWKDWCWSWISNTLATWCEKLTLCNPMNRSTPGLPVHHQLPESTQTHGHQVRDAIQPSYPLSSPSPLPPISPNIRVFSNESTLHMRWPKYWSFSFSVSPSNEGWSPLEWTGWISLQSKGLSRVFSNTTVQKHQFFGA